MSQWRPDGGAGLVMPAIPIYDLLEWRHSSISPATDVFLEHLSRVVSLLEKKDCVLSRFLC
ncbi:unnamed protein product [marine sediment metagenome]|uniref:Uncharacterized protein n=1 Tax=marine sediment metagenome TaxID=412755 RepID=X0XT01_9ZZZZ|eukprot:m.17419 g.17419  ORF g.17419 m.17419 type:complete len:61 (+) comp3243_c0_seq1:335-517(+)